VSDFFLFFLFFFFFSRIRNASRNSSRQTSGHFFPMLHLKVIARDLPILFEPLTGRSFRYRGGPQMHLASPDRSLLVLLKFRKSFCPHRCLESLLVSHFHQSSGPPFAFPNDFGLLLSAEVRSHTWVKIYVGIAWAASNDSRQNNAILRFHSIPAFFPCPVLLPLPRAAALFTPY